GPGIDVRADIAAVFTLENFRGGAGEFDVLDTALEFTDGILDGLAVFGADQLGDLLLVLLQQLLEAEHDLRALGRRGVAPGRESRLGGIDGQLHGGAISQADSGGGVAGGRVVHRGGATTAGNQFAVDQVLYCAHGVLCSLERKWVGGRSRSLAGATAAPTVTSVTPYACAVIILSTRSR